MLASLRSAITSRRETTSDRCGVGGPDRVAGRYQVTDRHEQRDLADLMRAVERLDQLADMAELMGDIDGSTRFRQFAVEQRMLAMKLLDD